MTPSQSNISASNDREDEAETESEVEVEVGCRRGEEVKERGRVRELV